MQLQADCDFTVKLVHASAADLDLARLAATNTKKPSTKYDNLVLSSCVWSSAHTATSCLLVERFSWNSSCLFMMFTCNLQHP